MYLDGYKGTEAYKLVLGEEIKLSVIFLDRIFYSRSSKKKKNDKMRTD